MPFFVTHCKSMLFQVVAWPRPANGLGGNPGDACRVAADSDSLLA